MKEDASVEFVRDNRGLMDNSGPLVAIRFILFERDEESGARSVKDICEWNWDHNARAIARRMARHLKKHHGFATVDDVDVRLPDGLVLHKRTRLLESVFELIIQYQLDGKDEKYRAAREARSRQLETVAISIINAEPVPAGLRWIKMFLGNQKLTDEERVEVKAFIVAELAERVKSL